MKILFFPKIPFKYSFDRESCIEFVTGYLTLIERLSNTINVYFPKIIRYDCFSFFIFPGLFTSIYFVLLWKAFISLDSATKSTSVNWNLLTSKSKMNNNSQCKQQVLYFYECRFCNHKTVASSVHWLSMKECAQCKCLIFPKTVSLITILN